MSADTIAALSTPPGTAGLAVVRLSGPACRAVAAACLGRPDPEPRRLAHGRFRDPATGEILDDPAFVFLAGPASSTGEDMLEIFPHGNPLLVERLIDCLLAFPGVRPAGPGEFTRRALENGRIDLLAAEAVGELIHARTLSALRNARRLADGALAAPLASLRDALLDLSARLELDVDFAEEEADPDFASWLPRVEAIRDGLAGLIRGCERGRALARVPRVVLLGAPNAGKSSLVNALVEEDRVLVSEVAGTTRDYVEVPLRLPGGLAHLVDTAGLGRPVDGLDERAQERTRAQGARADLVLWVEDGTAEPAPLPAAEAPVLRVRTRADLPGFRHTEVTSGEPGEAQGSPAGTAGPAPGSRSGAEPSGDPGAARDPGAAPGPGAAGRGPALATLAVSNRSRAGLADLLARLDSLLFRERAGDEEDARLATERQYRAALAARERVEAALAQLRGRPAVEILAFEIREAAGHLRDLMGEITPDEVLSKVFAGYCIGK